ncbi:MAG: BrnT family toxin [Gammaproteobacteria bacterium]|nr:BrnT family toxin [Gammaproteobacteria bacterium]
MKIDFDPEKSKKNDHTRGLPFERATEFDWETASYSEDTRNPYPERRFVAMGYCGDRLHVLCFTPIEDGVRIISFRKANLREVKRYEKETTHP